MKNSFYGFLTLVLAFACLSFAAPKPAVVQGPNQWTLTTTFTHPEQLVLKQASDNKTIRFWYIIITITNNTNKDVDFYPKCELATDTFQIIPAGKGVGSIVFERIKERHKSRYPFLELLGKTDNKILQGEDNTKDIAIVWPDFDYDAKNISIFLTGLSNEIAVVEFPGQITEDPNNDGPKKIYIHKTLEMKYVIKGNPASANGATLEYKEKSWVMR